eukprot:SAG11_NODE_2157_length_3731_cov_10.095540_1_plen_70_part_10
MERLLRELGMRQGEVPGKPPAFDAKVRQFTERAHWAAVIVAAAQRFGALAVLPLRAPAGRRRLRPRAEAP